MDIAYLAKRLSLDGKKAIVTGASGGIGAAIAKSLARFGAEVAVLGRNEDKIRETEREILLRRYIFLETLESIGEDLGFSRRSVYNRHSKAVSRVQKLLDSRKKTGDAVCA